MDKKPYANNTTLSMPANQTRVLKNQVSMLGRAIGNIFLPIVAKVLPYLNQLVYALRELAEWIVQLLGFEDFDWGNATGADNSAIGDLLDDTEGVSDNLDKAADNAKKFKAQLQGFDKLNNLTTTDDSDTDNGGAGAGGIDTGLLEGALDDALSRYQKRWDEAFKNMNQSFSTFADNVKKAFEEGGLYGVGQYFAKTMTDALNSIPWDGIKEKAGQAGKAIAQFLNGLTNPELFSAISKTFVEGINTAFTFLNDFVKEYDFTNLGTSIGAGLNTAMDTIDWDLIFDFAGNFGKKMADFFNAVTKETRWGKAGETIAKGLSAITKAIQTFIDNTHWDDVGKAIGTFINGLFTYDFTSLGETLGSGLTAAFTLAKNALSSIKFEEIGENVTSGLYEAFKKLDFSEISGTLSSAFSGLLDLLSGVIKGIKWRNLPKDIAKKVVQAFKGYNYKQAFKSLGNLAGTLIGALFDLNQGIRDVFKDIAKKIKNYFVKKIKAAGFDKDKSLWENGKSIIVGVFNGIIDFYKGIGSWVKNNVLNPFSEGIVKGLSSSGLYDSGMSLITKVFAGILNFAAGIKTWVDTNVIQKIKDAFADAKFPGIFDPIVNAWNSIIDKINDVTGKIDFLGIKIPTIPKINIDAETTDKYDKTMNEVSKTDRNTTLHANAKKETSYTNVKQELDKGSYNTTLNVKAKKNKDGDSGKLYNNISNGFSSSVGIKAKKNKDGDSGKLYSSISGGFGSSLSLKAKKNTTDKTSKNLFSDITNGFKSTIHFSADWQKGVLSNIKGEAEKALMKADNSSFYYSGNTSTKKTTTTKKKKKKADGGFLPRGQYTWKGLPNIKRYASGGDPTRGTLFWAGEAGAEIVGNTTRGTEVLNQSQIAQAMAESMESANAQQNAIMRQQNQLLREEINVLHAILEKTGITEGEVFSAVRNADANYARVNGHSAFA